MVTNRSAPALSGVQLESANYQIMGAGLTDRIFLLGHGDIGLNNPYQVIDIQLAIDTLGANTDSPLMRGMIEAYYAGARDIYLVAAAPMVEYVPIWTDRIGHPAAQTSAAMLSADPSWSPPPGYSTGTWDTLDYFQRYAIRLNNTYQTLADWDLPQMVVPLNAPYYNTLGVDFLNPLVDFCQDHFDTTGAVCLGFMGAQLQKIVSSNLVTGWTADIINDIKAMPIAFPGDNSGMFVSVFLGEATFNFKQFPVSYSASPVAVIAGFLSSQPLNQGVTWQPLPNVVSLSGPNLAHSDMNTICELGLNPIVRTTLGKRGNFFQVVAATDNTGALNGSDYWSLVQVRLIMRVIEDLQTLGRRYLGSIGFGQAKLDMQQYFLNMVSQGVLRSFDLNITQQSSTFNGQPDLMKVDVGLQPYFGLRQINFVAFVGPGA